MEFFKKLFGGKQNDDKKRAALEETFVCENCHQERLLSQKKEHMANEEKEKPKNVCEFC
ncbi:MAG: hypothetical protein HYT93_04225 [Parcubacteria group bacterium]|nr:hypothetical protein [Parcubacteria group bacterium]